jgi:ABC-type multidrug transport system fused ATPase/permease subunit
VSTGIFVSTGVGWRLIGRNLAVHKGALVRALLWSAVGSLPALLSGLLIAAALNHGFLVGDTTVGLACLGSLIPLFGLSAFATCRLFPWCADVVEGVRDNLVTTVATGAISSGTEFSASGGRNVARCVEQVEVVRNLLAALSRSLRQLFMPIVAAIIGLAVLSPILAAVVAPQVLLSMALYVWLVRRVATRQRAGAIADEQLAEQAAAVFAGMRDVTAHGAGEWATTRLVGAAKTSAAAAAAVAKANTARALVVALGAQLPLLAVLGVAALLVPDGRLGIGATVGAVTYVTTALAPALRTMVHSGGGWLVQLGVLTSRIAETAADVPVAPTKPTEPGEPGDLAAMVEAASGPAAIPTMALATHGLRFRYGAGADDVVNGLDLAVPAGDHLAIVGPSGGGKSTLALLLASVLTPTEGCVSLDGRPLQEWAATERHGAIAVIPQQAYVFAGTVQENLTYLCPAATTAQVEQAVTSFGLGATVQRLGGLEADLPAGGQVLSAGERQSLALARAWLSPASVVVLDEATCHLDAAAEVRAEAAFRARGGSLVVIAHRFGSALRAHRVLMAEGPSWVQGTHDELLASCPRYRELYGISVYDASGPFNVPKRPAPALAS